MNYDDMSDQPAHYQRTNGRQLAVQRSRGRRRMGFGAIWLAAGLLITIITLAHSTADGFFVIAFGPIIGGGFQMISGYRMSQSALDDPRRTGGEGRAESV